MSKCPFRQGEEAFSSRGEEEGRRGETAEQKLESVWQKVMENRVFSYEGSWPSISSLMSEDYSSIYENKVDVQEAKSKVLCSRGALAKVRIEWFEHRKYTGLFKKADHGIIRLTSAILGSDSIPSWLGSVSSSKIFPCCALKFFRSNKDEKKECHSGNFLFGGKKTGQSEEDFFAHPVCTHLTEKINFILSWILAFFRQYTTYPTQLGVSDFAAACENGDDEEEVLFPWCLALVPKISGSTFKHQANVDQDVNDSDEIPYITQLLKIPKGTVIYDVYCIPSPSCLTEDTKGNVIERIGRVVTTTKFVQSAYDQQIFFKHQRKEEDYALRPDWLNAVSSIHANTGSSFFEKNIIAGKFKDFECMDSAKK